MISTRKLALRIAAVTAAGLVVGIAALGFTVYRNAPKAVAPEIVIQLGHSGTVAHVAFSPDGQTLASASDDASIRLCRSWC